VIAIEYPPYVSSKLADFGSTSLLLQVYARQHFKLPLRFVFLPPARAQRKIHRGSWCISFYPPKFNNHDAIFVPLSSEVVQLGLYRIKKNSEFTYHDLSELSGNVAVLRSIKPSNDIKALQQAGLNIVFVESLRQGFEMMKVNRVQYVVGDNKTLQTHFSRQSSHQFQFATQPLKQVQVGFFYNKHCKSKLFTSPPGSNKHLKIIPLIPKTTTSR